MAAIVRAPAPRTFAISAFPMTSVAVGPSHGERGRQQDLRATARGAAGPPRGESQPGRAQVAHDAGSAVAERLQASFGLVG